ncbi:SIR2 family NAD-dependent protein deacylase [Hydrogenimonas thermophila]|uniref:protein acetyllysine N-acetyltransferase n=1 Tax=Hydrogenimonas thermophila TaxID=223786 RepID=A0A1I5TKJ4_9BACT|nr:Sir2 family NAD-dependent protein deacetylase [Hydrogenimonas thermophila]WOE71077.1 Sir2 family NAD-dependent protein deacetylase [Hydrogenimonas thermophila]WOE73595.1 Sir2 family NAD-dependent protein deacetylase [Hydrogenimonas thermophila]SFP83570.1 NAD-dependent deacetylase [Hydrogenimonas thermophila]
MSPKKIIFFSGAGISAPSGIKTFRDVNGLWENHKIDEVCNFYTWKENFELVHRFYNQRRVQLKDVKPNEGHLVLEEFLKSIVKRVS